jgi:hypothetical protein
VSRCGWAEFGEEFEVDLLSSWFAALGGVVELVGEGLPVFLISPAFSGQFQNSRLRCCASV